MNETVKYILDEYKLRKPKGKNPKERIPIPKSVLKSADISPSDAVKEIRNHPSIFDEGVIDRRKVIIIPSVNDTNL